MKEPVAGGNSFSLQKLLAQTSAQIIPPPQNKNPGYVSLHKLT